MSENCIPQISFHCVGPRMELRPSDWTGKLPLSAKPFCRPLCLIFEQPTYDLFSLVTDKKTDLENNL